MQFKKGQLVERVSTGERGEFRGLCPGSTSECYISIRSLSGIETFRRCNFEDLKHVDVDSEWIPVEKILPKTGVDVWVTRENGRVYKSWVSEKGTWRYHTATERKSPVIAWTPYNKPAPYVPPKPAEPELPETCRECQFYTSFRMPNERGEVETKTLCYKGQEVDPTPHLINEVPCFATYRK